MNDITSISGFVKNGASLQKGFANANAADQLSAGAYDAPGAGSTTSTINTPSTKGGGFGNTAVGGFLSDLFSKQNVDKYVNTGLDLLKSKADQKATQQQIELAQLNAQQQQNLNYAGTGAAPSTTKWVVPVVVGVLVVGTIITIVMVTRKKK